MAEAKKCDRCGNLYEEKGCTNIFEQIINDFFSPIIPNSSKRKGRAIDLLKDVYDLCPECANSLKEWFDNKEETQIQYGCWEKQEYRSGKKFLICSNCHSVIDITDNYIDENEFAYCPYCCAKMEGDDK